MPLRQISPTRSSDHEALVSDLLAEWQNPQSGLSEPVILEERDREGRLAHVYVVWDKWAGIDRVRRSEIIMDAAERKLPSHEALNITIAMGLTREEAGRLGLTC